MYKSPIELKIEDIVSDVTKQADEYTLRCFQQIGINIDKYELIKALEYDRGQYEKGWHDRDSEIVRCKDCKWSYWNNCECIRNRLYRHNSISLEGELYFRKIEPDDFCSWGERREDDKH